MEGFNQRTRVIGTQFSEGEAGLPLAALIPDHRVLGRFGASQRNLVTFPGSSSMPLPDYLAFVNPGGAGGANATHGPVDSATSRTAALVLVATRCSAWPSSVLRKSAHWASGWGGRSPPRSIRGQGPSGRSGPNRISWSNSPAMRTASACSINRREWGGPAPIEFSTEPGAGRHPWPPPPRSRPESFRKPPPRSPRARSS